MTLSEIVEKSQEIVIYTSHTEGCQWGPEGPAQAVKWGFQKVYYFQTGLSAWKAAGYPVDMDKR